MIPCLTFIFVDARSWMNRKREMESFSTFGGTRASSASRLSQTRLDLKPECDNNMISLMHNGKEFHSIPRRVPNPTVPSPHPHVCLHVDTVEPCLPSPKSANSHYETQTSSLCSTPRLQWTHPPESLEEGENEDLEEETVPERKVSVVTSISTPVWTLD